MPTKKLRSKKIANGSPKAMWKATTAGIWPKDPEGAEQFGVGIRATCTGTTSSADDGDEDPVAAGELNPGEGVSGERTEDHNEERWPAQ